MKLKQLFCRHKKQTAIKIYEHINPYFTSTWKDIRIICKCNRCDKEREYSGHLLQDLRHDGIYDIDVSQVISSELWGKWW